MEVIKHPGPEGLGDYWPLTNEDNGACDCEQVPVLLEWEEQGVPVLALFRGPRHYQVVKELILWVGEEGILQHGPRDRLQCPQARIAQCC